MIGVCMYLFMCVYVTLPFTVCVIFAFRRPRTRGTKGGVGLMNASVLKRSSVTVESLGAAGGTTTVYVGSNMV